MTALPRLKARVKLNFPAVVSGVDGIDVTKENGTYSIGLGIASLEDTGALTTDNFGDFNVPVYNEQTGIYTKLTLDTLRDGIAADFPVSDAAFVLEDDGDATKKLQFQLSGITTATTRTLTVPNASTTIVGTDTTQTLSNKTLTAPVIGAATGTSLTLSGALIVGTDATIGASSVYAWNGRTLWSAPADGQALLRDSTGATFGRLMLGGTTSSFPAIKRNGSGIDFRVADDSGYANIAAGSGTFSGAMGAVGNFSLLNATAIPAGGTQGIGYLLSSTANFGTIFGSGAPTASMARGSFYLRSDGVPYYNTNGTTGWDALVGATATQTLTNKTLTSPAITTPTGIVKGDVGLGNVDNTSDATKNAAVATLTNKTLTAPVISTITNTGTLTLPTSTDTLVGRATTDTLTNKTLDTPNITTGFKIGGAATSGNYARGNGTNFVSSAIQAADLPTIPNTSGSPSASFGAVKVDGTTITATSGVLTAIGGAASDISVGTTTVSSGTSGYLLYNNAGTLGNQTIASALGARATLPTRQVFTSGSGTYTTPANVLWIEVEAVGGGGGGSGSGTGGTGGNGGAGGNTTFGTFTAVGGGAGGVVSTNPGGGTTGSPQISATGGRGTAGYTISSSGTSYASGGDGGASYFGGNGGGGGQAAAGSAASTNSGAGGGGGGGGLTSSLATGSGGSAGGYFRTIINSPSATYSYGIGAAGTAGTAGTSGFAGGAGGSGYIIVTEHYGS